MYRYISFCFLASISSLCVRKKLNFPLLLYSVISGCIFISHHSALFPFFSFYLRYLTKTGTDLTCRIFNKIPLMFMKQT